MKSHEFNIRDHLDAVSSQMENNFAVESMTERSAAYKTSTLTYTGSGLLSNNFQTMRQTGSIPHMKVNNRHF